MSSEHEARTSDDSRIDSILGDWRARRDAGEDVSQADVIAAHPDLADSLRARFDALAAISAAKQPTLRDVPAERYADFRVLGAGGMGIVYWALDTDLNRQVAFKVVRPDAGQSGGTTPDAPLALSPPSKDTPSSSAFATLKARFLQEAWVTAGLEHPGIVPVYEVGQTPEGVPYYTMRFVKSSRTFAAAIEGALGRGIDERLALLEPFLKVCDTIRYAHAHGVIHRDLKPDNVMLGEFGEVVVVDWGLAKMLGKPDAFGETWQHRLQEFRDATDLRTMASALGTPGYMAPEAAVGRIADVDVRSDVYSLGAILFQILTGRLPYEFGTYVELLMKLMREDAPDAATLDVSVPAELARIAGAALARDREARTASVDALVADVRGWMAAQAQDRELAALREQAKAALAAASDLTGDTRLHQLDRAASACDLVLAKCAEDATATQIRREIDAMRAKGVEERAAAVRGKAMRRAGIAAAAVAAVGTASFVWVLSDEKAETERQRDFASAERRLADDARTKAETARAETAAALVRVEEEKSATERALRAAESQRLVTRSRSLLASDPALAANLALAASRLDPGHDPRDALRSALLANRRERTVDEGVAAEVADVQWLPDETAYAVLLRNGELRLRNASDGQISWRRLWTTMDGAPAGADRSAGGARTPPALAILPDGATFVVAWRGLADVFGRSESVPARALSDPPPVGAVGVELRPMLGGVRLAAAWTAEWVESRKPDGADGSWTDGVGVALESIPLAVSLRQERGGLAAWDLATGKRTARIPLRLGSRWDVSAERAQAIATDRADGTVQVHDLATGRELGSWTPPDGHLRGVGVLEGLPVAVCSRPLAKPVGQGSDEIYVHDPVAGTDRVLGPTKLPAGGRIDGRAEGSIVFVDGDNCTHVLPTAAGSAPFDLPGRVLSEVHVSKDGRLIWWRDASGGVEVRSADAGSPVCTLPGSATEGQSRIGIAGRPCFAMSASGRRAVGAPLVSSTTTWNVAGRRGALHVAGSGTALLGAMLPAEDRVVTWTTFAADALARSFDGGGVSRWTLPGEGLPFAATWTDGSTLAGWYGVPLVTTWNGEAPPHVANFLDGAPMPLNVELTQVAPPWIDVAGGRVFLPDARPTKSVRVRSLADGGPLADLELPALAWAFRPLGADRLVTLRDGGVDCWDIVTARRVWTRDVPGMRALAAPMNALETLFRTGAEKFATAGDAVVVLYPGEALLLRGTDGGEVARHTCGTAPTQCALSADGRFVALGAADGTVVVHDMRDGRRVARPEAPNLPVSCLKFDRAGTHLAAAWATSRVRAWNTSDWKMVLDHAPDVRVTPALDGFTPDQLAFSLSGARLAAVLADGSVDVLPLDAEAAARVDVLPEMTPAERLEHLPPDGATREDVATARALVAVLREEHPIRQEAREALDAANDVSAPVRACARLVLASSRDDPAGLVRLAMRTLLTRGRPDADVRRALALAEHAAKIDPSSAEASFAVALGHLRAGDVPAAFDDLRRCVVEHPGFVGVGNVGLLSALATVQKRRGHDADAKATLTALRQILASRRVHLVPETQPLFDEAVEAVEGTGR